MKIQVLFLMTIFFGFLPTTFSQTQYALIIGINNYDADEFGFSSNNLNGCVNDALAIKDLLLYNSGCKLENIVQLVDSQAAKDSIMDAFNQILAISKKGDKLFFYYAGHGSQVENELSTELDKMDEVIVPFDCFSKQKVIRDKELNAIFASFSKKGIGVTAVLDCCHSGSISRGISDSLPKVRSIEKIKFKVNNKDQVVDLSQADVLIFSASQDFQPALELQDEQRNVHGILTWALLKSLNTLSANCPVNKIFESTRAIMFSKGLGQEPVLECPGYRRKLSLTGNSNTTNIAANSIAVMEVVKTDSVKIQGGQLIGLGIASELSQINNTDSIILKVTSFSGMNNCYAKLLNGDIQKVKPGTFLEITKWVYSDKSVLTINANSYPGTFDELKNIAINITNQLKTIKGIEIITDPVKEKNIQTIYYAKNNWWLNVNGKQKFILGSSLDFSLIKNKIKVPGKLFISLPADIKAIEFLNKKLKETGVIKLSKNQDFANYFMVGRQINGNIEYALVEPYSSNKEYSAMPLRTDFISADINIKVFADSINLLALKLAKIKLWLDFSPPGESSYFPYSLVLRNANTGQIVKNGIANFEQIYGIGLERDSVLDPEKSIANKYVYVFAIDNKGETTLLYPRSTVENIFPPTSQEAEAFYQLGNEQLFRVETVESINTFIMLATNQQLADPQALETTGVQTRGLNDGLPSGLGDLVDLGGITRGEIAKPAKWLKNVLIIRSEK